MVLLKKIIKHVFFFFFNFNLKQIYTTNLYYLQTKLPLQANVRVKK